MGISDTGKEAECSGSGKKPFKFGVGHSAESETVETSWLVGHYLGDPNNPCVTVVDTPGTGDTEGRDCNHAINLAQGVREIGSIEIFLLLFKGTNTRYKNYQLKSLLMVHFRFETSIQDQIRRYESLFGEAFYDNVVTEFTFW